MPCKEAVSYTHLDVYKRQLQFYLEALICAEKSSFIDEVVYYHRTDVAGSISASFDNRIMDIGKCFAIVQSRMDQMEKRQTMENLLRTLQLRHLMYQWERISSVNFADQQMIAQWLCQKIYETMKQGVISVSYTHLRDHTANIRI